MTRHVKQHNNTTRIHSQINPDVVHHRLQVKVGCKHKSPESFIGLEQPTKKHRCLSCHGWSLYLKIYVIVIIDLISTSCCEKKPCIFTAVHPVLTPVALAEPNVRHPVLEGLYIKMLKRIYLQAVWICPTLYLYPPANPRGGSMVRFVMSTFMVQAFQHRGLVM